MTKKLADASFEELTAQHDAALAALAGVGYRLAALRDQADLQPTAAELLEANRTGDLVCWRECKSFSADEARYHRPGEPVPAQPPGARLLDPSTGLLTTAGRWAANRAYKAAARSLDDGGAQTALRQAWAQYEAAHAARVEADKVAAAARTAETAHGASLAAVCAEVERTAAALAATIPDALTPVP